MNADRLLKRARNIVDKVKKIRPQLNAIELFITDGPMTHKTVSDVGDNSDDFASWCRNSYPPHKISMITIRLDLCNTLRGYDFTDLMLHELSHSLANTHLHNDEFLSVEKQLKEDYYND